MGLWLTEGVSMAKQRSETTKFGKTLVLARNIEISLRCYYRVATVHS